MSKGIIERIDEHDVAWGVMEDGKTLDVPSYGHKAGDEIVLNFRDEDEGDEFGDVSVILMSETFATVITADIEDDGLAIRDVQRFQKGVN